MVDGTQKSMSTSFLPAGVQDEFMCSPMRKQYSHDHEAMMMQYIHLVPCIDTSATRINMIYAPAASIPRTESEKVHGCLDGSVPGGTPSPYRDSCTCVLV